MRKLLLLSFVLITLGCESDESIKDGIEAHPIHANNSAPSIGITNPTILYDDGKQTANDEEKVQMWYFEEIKKFDRSQFQHNGIRTFEAILTTDTPYPSFQDSAKNRYGIKQYYCDLTYNENFDLFVLLQDEGGDCTPMLYLYSTNKLDSGISQVQMTMACGNEMGSGSGHTAFQNDSTFTVYKGYSNQLFDSLGQRLNTWEGAVNETIYSIDNNTGLISVQAIKQKETTK